MNYQAPYQRYFIRTIIVNKPHFNIICVGSIANIFSKFMLPEPNKNGLNMDVGESNESPKIFLPFIVA